MIRFLIAVARAALALLALASPALAQSVSRPPNVLLILSDDQGAVDLGVWGCEDVATPHLDRLASEGVRFTQLYAGAPVCSPSRAALLTGRVPQRCGVPGNVGRGAPGLPASEITLAEMLGGAGYATGLVGKWHLGHGGGRGPLDQGFQSFLGFQSFFGHKGSCIDNWSHFFYWSGPNVHDLWRDEEEVWEEGVHFGDLIVREARRFLADHREHPFFIFVPFNSPHYPLQGKRDWRERYADLPSPRRHYAALLSTLDEQVGEILAALDEFGKVGHWTSTQGRGWPVMGATVQLADENHHGLGKDTRILRRPDNAVQSRRLDRLRRFQNASAIPRNKRYQRRPVHGLHRGDLAVEPRGAPKRRQRNDEVSHRQHAVLLWLLWK